jgi:uncharacterized coiled-coil protein SlyX
MTSIRLTRSLLIVPLVGAWLGASACRLNPTIHPTPADTTGRATSARQADLEQRVARLELRLLERDAQIEELQTRLDDARQEVVRAMAKLQTLATRAEAASGMAEAEVAVQPLQGANGQSATPEYAQARRLLDQSTAEFNKSNYGGALYLANQAKSLAGVGKGRLASTDRGSLRAGEVPFAVPLNVQATGHANVREGPGTAFRVAFTLESGAGLVAYSYADEWVRITDDGGRSGWIYRTLIGRRGGGGGGDSRQR